MWLYKKPQVCTGDTMPTIWFEVLTMHPYAIINLSVLICILGSMHAWASQVCA